MAIYRVDNRNKPIIHNKKKNDKRKMLKNDELKIGLNCVLSPVLIISKAVFANIENQITDAIVGMKIVVIKTFIVLPLDILAIKPQ
jgi:hypothetical protein